MKKVVLAYSGGLDTSVAVAWLRSQFDAEVVTLTVDLGSAQSAGRIVVQLPATWGSRSQTLSVLGSTDGSTFTTVKASAAYTFDPASTNTVTITFTATSQRYWRLNFTANTGWPAGQCSSFQLWTS